MRDGALALLASAMCAWPALAFAQTASTVTTTTEPGREVYITRFTELDKQCQSLGGPQIVITEPPAHGDVEIRSATFEFKRVIVGEKYSCVGKQVEGRMIYYIPAAGFHGTDQFELTATFSNGDIHRTIIVKVK